MLKNIQKIINIKLAKSLMIFSLVYCLLFNSVVIIYKFHYFSYKKTNKDKWKSMKSKAVAKKFISHDYVFHTILDYLNVKLDVIKLEFSLCK